MPETHPGQIRNEHHQKWFCFVAHRRLHKRNIVIGRAHTRLHGFMGTMGTMGTHDALVPCAHESMSPWSTWVCDGPVGQCPCPGSTDFLISDFAIFRFHEFRIYGFPISRSSGFPVDRLSRSRFFGDLGFPDFFTPRGIQTWGKQAHKRGERPIRERPKEE